MKKRHGIFGKFANGSKFCLTFLYNAHGQTDIQALKEVQAPRVTACELALGLDENGCGSKDSCVGTALCCYRDNFERSFGRKLALTQALRRSGLDKTDRKQVWRTYRARGQNSTA